jgi:hypothetical protein
MSTSVSKSPSDVQEYQYVCTMVDNGIITNMFGNENYVHLTLFNRLYKMTRKPLSFNPMWF